MIAINLPFRRMTTAAAALCLGFTLLPSVGFTAPATQPPLITVQNAGFEEPASDSSVPGWNQVFGNGASDVFYSVSSTEKYEGSQSLLLDDRSSTKPLGLESAPFAVVPGTSYSASSMMKVENGSMAIYFRFFNGAGTKIAESSSWLTPTDGQWVKNAASTVVPNDAVTAAVLIYSSGAGITRGFADAVKVEENKIGTFERIGGIVNGMINEDAAVGTEDGKPVVYTVFKGRGEVPTSFAVIDALSRDVLRTFPMPGVEAAWGVEVATDGKVYIGTHYDGGLYCYTPGGRSFEHLGRFGSETHVFTMVAGPNGKVFAGTYPGGQLFEFDPAVGVIRDLGVLDPEQKYVRSLAYDAKRDVLYAGAGGSKSRIFKISPDGTRKELLGSLIPGGGDSYAWPYGMDFAEDRLFVKFSNGDLLVVRPDDTIDYYDPNGMDIHSGQVASMPGQPGRVLFTLGGHLYTYDSGSQSSALIKELEAGTNFQEGRFVDLNSPEWPGMTFVGMGAYGNMLYYNPDTGRTQVIPANYSGAPILIQSIHQGPENNIYAAGYMSGFTSYNPLTGAISDTNPLGQIESSAIRNGKMLLGAYAGARILEYDPKLPFSSNNPKQLFDLRAHSQDRPFTMAYAEDRDQLFVGTVPNTTSLEGALTMYDFKTQQVEIFRNIVPNQSIISVIYKDGLIYAGTTVYGGLGTSGPTETNAKLFIFDPVTKKKVFETIPVTGRKGVTGLSVGPDGLIWGVAEDTIFKFNPSNRQFVYKAAKLRRYKTDGTTWTYAFLQPGTDGNMYGTSRGQFFMMKPETNEFVLLNGSYGNYLNRDVYGNFYFSDNSSDLWKYTPAGLTTDTKPPVTTAAKDPAVPNGSGGWYSSPVTVSLHAKDEETGVTDTVYSTDSGATWWDYKAPLRFEQDGDHSLLFKSSDRSGNIESVQSIGFKLDASAPSLTIESPTEAVYRTSEQVTPRFSVADSVSGVDISQTKTTLDGQPFNPGATIQLYKLPIGPHTLTVETTDFAGNVKRESVLFHTAASKESLKELVDGFLNRGWIDNQGIANSLTQKLEQENLHAFVQETQAQSGKHIQSEAAGYLLRDAAQLLNK